MKKEWLVPLTGIGFVAVLIAGFAIGGEPKEAKEGAEAVSKFYKDNYDSVEAGAGVTGIAAVLLVFFGGYLRRLYSEAGSMTLATVVQASTAIMAAGAGLDGALSFAMAEGVDKNVDPNAILALQTFWDNDFLILAIGTAVFLLSNGISIVRHGVLPKWMGYVAILLGVVAVSPAGFVAFIGSGVWILVASVMLTLRARGEASAAA